MVDLTRVMSVRRCAVPPGRISRNTFKFLNNMQYPERNDREWFKLHEPAYRLAEKVGDCRHEHHGRTDTVCVGMGQLCRPDGASISTGGRRAASDASERFDREPLAPQSYSAPEHMMSSPPAALHSTAFTATSDSATTRHLTKSTLARPSRAVVERVSGQATLSRFSPAGGA